MKQPKKTKAYPGPMMSSCDPKDAQDFFAIMTLTEIKIALYKEKPTAQLRYENRHGFNEYITELDNGYKITFLIPLKEVTEDFVLTMPAQLLIRWIVTK